MEIKIVLSKNGENKVLYNDTCITLVCSEDSHLARENAIKLAVELVSKANKIR